MKIVRWIKKLFHREPARGISIAEIEESMERAQGRMKEELERQYFSASPLFKSLNVRPE